jgi:hypothetical protein
VAFRETKMNGQETQEYLDKAFTYHQPKDDQPDRYQKLRDEGRGLAFDIIHLCPASRETSLALTKLEECIMWANAAIARNE